MDSKNIFISASHMLRKCQWKEVVDKNEWRSVGGGVDFRIEDVQAEIDNFFSGNPLFIVTDRHGSRAIKAESAAQVIADSLSIGSIFVCEQDFSKFMEFNSIGVSRRGLVAS